MSHEYKMVMTLEFKDYRVDGPTVDQICGAARRARNRVDGDELIDVFIYCRGFTAEAQARASEVEAIEGIGIIFVIVKEGYNADDTNGVELHVRSGVDAKRSGRKRD